MIIKTRDFSEITNKIAIALSSDKTAANLEIKAKDNTLYLAVTNKEFYVSCTFDLESSEEFRAVVNANLFLNLVAGVSTETFEMYISNNYVKINAGKSNYKIPMIYENDKLIDVKPIFIENPTVEMTISNDVLASILNVNGREVAKAKTVDVQEIQKLYYVDNEGCFTFTTGACLNRFTLDQPVKMLLSDKIVKLFKLFREDVDFSFGIDVGADGLAQTKAVFQTGNIYVAAIVNCDSLLLAKISAPYKATKDFIDAAYPIRAVVSVKALSDAIGRFTTYVKNTDFSVNASVIKANLVIDADTLTIIDEDDNSESVDIENQVEVESTYLTKINVVELKSILDSCKMDHVTINCGHHNAFIINHGQVSNLLKEFTK